MTSETRLGIVAWLVVAFGVVSVLLFAMLMVALLP